LAVVQEITVLVTHLALVAVAVLVSLLVDLHSLEQEPAELVGVVMLVVEAVEVLPETELLLPEAFRAVVALDLLAALLGLL
jgi:hypothetical protein